MATIEVACAECGQELPIEPAALGTQVKCPRCKTIFVAEQGDAYGLADEPAPQVHDRRSGAGAGPRPAGPAPARPAAKPAARKPEPPPRAETREERAQRERMEKWAEKMDQ